MSNGWVRSHVEPCEQPYITQHHIWPVGSQSHHSCPAAGGFLTVPAQGPGGDVLHGGPECSGPPGQHGGDGGHHKGPAPEEVCICVPPVRGGPALCRASDAPGHRDGLALLQRRGLHRAGVPGLHLPHRLPHLRLHLHHHSHQRGEVLLHCAPHEVRGEDDSQPGHCRDDLHMGQVHPAGAGHPVRLAGLREPQLHQRGALLPALEPQQPPEDLRCPLQRGVLSGSLHRDLCGLLQCLQGSPDGSKTAHPCAYLGLQPQAPLRLHQQPDHHHHHPDAAPEDVPGEDLWRRESGSHTRPHCRPVPVVLAAVLYLPSAPFAWGFAPEPWRCGGGGHLAGLLLFRRQPLLLWTPEPTDPRGAVQAEEVLLHAAAGAEKLQSRGLRPGELPPVPAADELHGRDALQLCPVQPQEYFGPGCPHPRADPRGVQLALIKHHS